MSSARWGNAAAAVPERAVIDGFMVVVPTTHSSSHCAQRNFGRTLSLWNLVERCSHIKFFKGQNNTAHVIVKVRRSELV